MKKNIEQVDLVNLNGGAVLELFVAEWAKVLANVNDPNTKPDALREIVIKVKVKPDKLRRAASTEVTIGSKLPGIKPHESFIYFEHENGNVQAYPDDPKQGELELDESSNITPISQAK